MAKAPSGEAQMVTANRLRDGTVVYLTADSAWSERFADGALWSDKDSADSALTASETAVAAQLVVGPYLIEAAVTDRGPQPTSAKERIRADHKPTFAADAGSWAGRISD
jgi:hypothetical protein